MNYYKNEAGQIQPQAFTFNASNQQVRTVAIDGQPYFVAKDVCDVLQLSDVSKSVERLDEDEKLTRKLFVSGQNREVWLVNESGLYNLIFRSTKPEARAFCKWVTAEVLPAIRQTGRYEVRRTVFQSTAKRYVRPKEWLDLRSEPYGTKTLYGGSVRVITHEDVEWYSLGDVMRVLGVTTSAWQNAAMLNAGGRELARKIFIFGNTHPAWFTTRTGVRLVISGSRKFTEKEDVHVMDTLVFSDKLSQKGGSGHGC